jgi:tetratricopeptide (TPR) repeat protein
MRLPEMPVKPMNCLKRLLGLFLCCLAFLLCSDSLFSQQNSIDSLKNILTHSIDDTSKINTLNILSWELRNIDPDTAITLSTQALQISQRSQWTKGIANSARQIGWFNYLKGDYRLGLNHLLRALTAYEEMIASSDPSLTLEGKTGKSRTLGNIGTIYQVQSDYPKAVDFYFKALKMDEELSNKIGIARNLGNIGTLYHEQSDYSKALAYYLKALKIREELGDKGQIALILGNIGTVFNEQKDYSKALDYYFKALKIYEETGNKNGIAAYLGNIGVVYGDQGDYQKASDYYFRALKINEEIGNKSGTAMLLSNIGSHYIKKGDFKEAEIYLKRSLALADSINARGIIKADHQNLSQLYDTTGKTALAFFHFKQFIAARDSMNSEENQKNQVRTEMNYEFEKKESLAKAEQDKKDALAAEEKQRQKVILYAISLGLFFVLLFAIFIFRANRQKQKANVIITQQKNEVEKQKQIIEVKNKDITDSINYAQRIQAALFASDELLNKNLGEYFVMFRPKDIISGDFYWATEVKDKNGNSSRFYLAICDSTGHGVPGAFMSLLNISFLNEAITEKGIVQPNEIFNHVRQRLIENISSDGAKDGMDGILICIDRSSKIISYAGAINAPYIMNSALQELPMDKMPVGLSDKKDSFTHREISFQHGNILYLYTDGFADQFGGPKGKKIKYKQLNQLLSVNSPRPMAEQKEMLEKAFDEWKGNLEQIDDVLIIGIRL